MKNNVPCALIRDLVPLYAEDLVSDETRKELETHIQECEECKAYYDRATKEMECEMDILNGFMHTRKETPY